MAALVCPDVIVCLCHNCIPAGARVPRQWKQGDALVLAREVPCTGKIDAQYLFHALEAGALGLCVVACPKGDCTLAQGNYRAEVRIRTIQRLLTEIGLEPQRAELLHCSPDDSVEHFETLVRDAAKRLCALGQTPIRQHDAVEHSPALPATEAKAHA